MSLARNLEKEIRGIESDLRASYEHLTTVVRRLGPSLTFKELADIYTRFELQYVTDGLLLPTKELIMDLVYQELEVSVSLKKNRRAYRKGRITDDKPIAGWDIMASSGVLAFCWFRASDDRRLKRPMWKWSQDFRVARVSKDGKWLVPIIHNPYHIPMPEPLTPDLKLISRKEFLAEALESVSLHRADLGVLKARWEKALSEVPRD